MNDLKITRTDYPNLLLVAGNGRNVGKTWLACQLIRQLSETNNITAIKISSHFHPVDKDSVLVENERFIISIEKKINSKDSSLMLQAGAEKVYFIMSPQQHLKEAFNVIKVELENKIVICESGGLNEFVNPGLFLFVMKGGSQIQKPHLLEYSPIVITNKNNQIDFDLNKISVLNGKFTIEK